MLAGCMTWTSIPRSSQARAIQKPSRPASKANTTRETARPARLASAFHPSIALATAPRSRAAMLFFGRRETPGTTAPSSHVLPLSSSTVTTVLA